MTDVRETDSKPDTGDPLVPDGIPSWQMPFWESLNEHSVRVQECAQCHTKRYTPKEICNRCFSTEWTWEPIAGTGSIYTYTTVFRAPTPSYQEDAPYVLVHVEMDEGFRMIGRLTDSPSDAVTIGARVEARYHPIGDSGWTALYFELS